MSSNPNDALERRDMDGTGGGSTSRSLTDIARSLVDGTSINWREFFSLFVAGWFLWVAGLLSSAISGAYRAVGIAVSWVIETTFAIWELIPASQTWLVAEAFDAAGRSLSEFGAIAFIVGVGLIIAWFVVMESIVAFLRGWWA